MWLILCEDDDDAAAWAHHGLRRRAAGRCELVTARDLFAPSRLTHRVGQDGVDVELRLADGRTVRGQEVTGTLNRLVWAGIPGLGRVQAADRQYATYEWHSACASWIHGLPGPVLNRPTGRGLCGAMPRPAEWALLAARAGLATRPLRLGAEPAAGAGAGGAGSHTVTTVLVVGDEVVADGLDPQTVDACRRLASSAAVDVAGIELATHPEDGEHQFHRASARPDLRRGGEPVLDALARALRPGGG